jgi:hypothetical protein
VAELVRSQGLDVRQPVSLRSTNNVVVWLAPSPVVAKISNDHDGAARELQLVSELVKAHAPVVPPSDLSIEQPLSIDEHSVTFWQYQPQDDVSHSSPAQIARSLFLLHSKLSSIADRVSIPPLRAQLIRVVEALERLNPVSDLSDDDRALLRQALIDGMVQLANLTSGDRVIHGSPHRMNILVVNETSRFIDFETVALGPLEWDLAHLEQEVANLYPIILDDKILDMCRVMVSAATSAWCWEGLHRGADMRSHAEHHLEVVRSSYR